MNIKKRLRHIADLSGKDRQIGKTTVLANAAKELDGILLGWTHQHARMLERQHGVTSRSYKMNLDGFRGPFFLDHFVLETLLYQAADKIETLEKKLEKAEKVIQMSQTAYDLLKEENNNE